MDLVNDLNTDKNTYSNEIISVFSQYFYDYFNHFDVHKKVFWHGKCYSIAQDKLNSYIKYKSKLIQVLISTYFLKKKDVKDAGKIPLSEKLEKCKQYKDYKQIAEIEKGILYFDGKKIEIDAFLNGKIKEIKNVDETMFSDII